MPLSLQGHSRGTPSDRRLSLPREHRGACRVAIAALRDLRRQRQIAVDLQRALLPGCPACPGRPGDRRAVCRGGRRRRRRRRLVGRHPPRGGSRRCRCRRRLRPRGPRPPSSWASFGRRCAPPPGRRCRPATCSGCSTPTRSMCCPSPGPRDPGTPPRFATSTYAVLEPYDEVLRVASAGHLPLLVADAAGPGCLRRATAGATAGPRPRPV